MNTRDFIVLALTLVVPLVIFCALVALEKREQRKRAEFYAHPEPSEWVRFWSEHREAVARAEARHQLRRRG